jgi:NitT/TauT family transport system substrate-binding protein
MKRSGGLSWLLAAAVLLVGAYAWFSRPARVPIPAAPAERVRIANIRYPGSCPVFAADAMGYFAAEGIAATVNHLTSGKLALDGILQGQAEFAVNGDLPIMFAVMDRQPISVVATIATAENDLGIVGRRDRGIAIAADLKGKRIGVTMRTGAEFVLDVILTHQKLSDGDVTLRELKPEELSAALANGDIDAASTWQPYLGTLRSQLGSNASVFLSGGIYDTTLNLVATQSYIANHSNTLKKVLRGLMRGAQFCRDTPAEAQKLVSEAMKPDTVDLKEVWPSYRYNVTLDQSLILALEDETRWAQRNKLTTRTDVPNYLNHIHLQALQDVAPAAVTVIH